MAKNAPIQPNSHQDDVSFIKENTVRGKFHLKINKFFLIVGIISFFILVIPIIIWRHTISKTIENLLGSMLSHSSSSVSPIPSGTPIISEPITNLHLTLVSSSATPTPASTIVVSGLPFYYTHPEGIFEIPKDTNSTIELVNPISQTQAISSLWKVCDETTSTVTICQEADQINIIIQASNTGYKIDHDSYERYIKAREENVFGDDPGYFILHQEVVPEIGFITQTITSTLANETTPIAGSTSSPLNTITSTVNYSTTRSIEKNIFIKDISTYVTSSYFQQNNIIYAIDISIPQAKYAEYSYIIHNLNEEIVFYPEAAANLPLYEPIKIISDPGDHIQMGVPIAWKKSEVSDSYTYAVTYSSPDGLMAVQFITYNDDTPVSKIVAGNFTLLLLNNYMTSDIMVTNDIVFPNGTEQLQWHSPRYDYQYYGITNFNSFGITFTVFSITYNINHITINQSIIDLLLSEFMVIYGVNVTPTP